MKKPFVIHPFLFAIYPILFLFSQNFNEMRLYPIKILLITMALLFITFILWLLLNSIFKDKNIVGLLLSSFSLFFFSYGHFYSLIRDFTIMEFLIGRHRYFLLFFGVLFIIIIIFILRLRKKSRYFTPILNFVAVTLIIISIINVGVYELKRRSAYHYKSINRDLEPSALINLKKIDKPPDIYYIILDGYGSTNTLKEIFGYDNLEFTDYLSNNGFFIASESYCNYTSTIRSMASSLNMTYLNKEVLKNTQILTNMIRNNKVIQSFKAIGYSYILFSSSWAPTAKSIHADITYNDRLFLGSEFSMIFMRTTMLILIEKFLGNTERNRISLTFEKLTEVPDIREPTFTFAHFIIPHPPYIFNRKGEGVHRSLSMIGWEPRNLYLDQLIFLNKKLENVIDTILAKSEVPPIIILQGDHGPRFNDITNKQRAQIFNSYYLPKAEKNVLYRSITPVNSFRLISNLYFDANLKLLSDELVDEIHKIHFK